MQDNCGTHETSQDALDFKQSASACIPFGLRVLNQDGLLQVLHGHLVHMLLPVVKPLLLKVHHRPSKGHVLGIYLEVQKK